MRAGDFGGAQLFNLQPARRSPAIDSGRHVEPGVPIPAWLHPLPNLPEIS
jgi:hypothetical protein